MKKIIRRLVNWAYGVNIITVLSILDQAKRNLSIILADLELRRRMDYKELEDDFSNIKHILDLHDKKLRKQ